MSNLESTLEIVDDLSKEVQNLGSGVIAVAVILVVFIIGVSVFLAIFKKMMSNFTETYKEMFQKILHSDAEENKDILSSLLRLQMRPNAIYNMLAALHIVTEVLLMSFITAQER